MQKAKNYDWKDSNMALVGSKEDRAFKKEAAEKEPAWEGLERQVAPFLRVWRIVNFQVTDWPEADYGMFYDGDSYIVLRIDKHPHKDEFVYDVHFWIGKHSTADEYGTAAYKTVELDNYLDDKPVQHREVQGHESAKFKSYFKRIEYLKGGADSGFRRVKTKEYKPRLLHFHGDRQKVTIIEVGAKLSKLDASDVFILDAGNTIYQWNGKTCNKDEKFKALQYVQNLKNERGSSKSETLDEEDVEGNHEFFKILEANNDLPDDDDEDSPKPTGPVTKSLHCLSDASGKLEFKKVQEGSLEKRALTDDDVWIVDNGEEVFVYIGEGCSKAEKANAFVYAHTYLQGTDHPLSSVTCLKNKDHESLDKCFAA